MTRELSRAWSTAMTEGTALADRLKLLGCTITETSKATGIDRSILNDYLNRRRPMTSGNRLRLAQFLRCEPEALTD